jgi:hypothetical protein
MKNRVRTEQGGDLSSFRQLQPAACGAHKIWEEVEAYLLEPWGCIEIISTLVLCHTGGSSIDRRAL